MGVAQSRCQGGAAKDEEVDIYRNTALRYMGYCNEASCTPISHSYSSIIIIAVMLGRGSVSTHSAVPRSQIPPQIVLYLFTLFDYFAGFVALTYLGSIGYVLADSRDKYYRAEKVQGPRAAKIEAADCLIWQGLASVAVPGLIIHRIVHAAKTLFNTPTFRSNMILRKFAPTIIGLSSIPLIIHPVDNVVHWGLDNTLRPQFAKMKETGEQNESNKK